MRSYYEMLSAKKYYGKHATGSVLLQNGSVVYHGATKDVKKMYEQTQQGIEIRDDRKFNVGKAIADHQNHINKREDIIDFYQYIAGYYSTVIEKLWYIGNDESREYIKTVLERRK